MHPRETANSVYSANTQRCRYDLRTKFWLLDAALVAIALLSVAVGLAASSCPSGPQYSDTRYDDDFSYLRDPACRNDFWDSLKYISLNARGDWYLSLGGLIRNRNASFHNHLLRHQLQSPGYSPLPCLYLFLDLH